MTHPQSFDQPIAKPEPKRLVRTLVCANCDHDVGENPLDLKRCPQCNWQGAFELVEVRK